MPPAIAQFPLLTGYHNSQGTRAVKLVVYLYWLPENNNFSNHSRDCDDFGRNALQRVHL